MISSNCCLNQKLIAKLIDFYKLYLEKDTSAQELWDKHIFLKFKSKSIDSPNSLSDICFFNIQMRKYLEKEYERLEKERSEKERLEKELGKSKQEGLLNKIKNVIFLNDTTGVIMFGIVIVFSVYCFKEVLIYQSNDNFKTGVVAELGKIGKGIIKKIDEPNKK